jgi:hypothetical protein
LTLDAGKTRGRLRALEGLAVGIIAAFACALSVAPAAAQVTLGTAATGTASCPTDCLVEARVTGFQTMVGGAKAPLVVPAPGRIVSWSINLGSPESSATKFFNKRFGLPAARLSILKPIPSRGGRKHAFRLLRKTPVQALRSHFGSLATFNLERPLKVAKGHGRGAGEPEGRLAAPEAGQRPRLRVLLSRRDAALLGDLGGEALTT